MKKRLSGFISLALMFLLMTHCSKEDNPEGYEPPTTTAPADTTSDGGNAGSTTNSPTSSYTLWRGSTISFSMAAGADHNTEANQDRITDNVWITRAGVGQLFNVRSENVANSNTSPAGTAWAQGTFDDIANLTFQPFRSACPNLKPKNAVGVPMVVHLIDDDVYIELTITAWGRGQVGGFTYTRSTP